MRKEEILNLLEDNNFAEEQNYVSGIDFGRLVGAPIVGAILPSPALAATAAANKNK